MSDTPPTDSETTGDAPTTGSSSDQPTTSFVSSRDFEPLTAGGDEPSVVPPVPAPTDPLATSNGRATTITTSAAVPTSATPAKAAPDAPRRSAARTFGVGVLVALLGFGGGLAAWYVADTYLGDSGSGSGNGAVFQPTNETSSGSRRSSSSTTSSDGGKTPGEIYTAMSPAVAHIDSRIVKTTTNFFGQQEQQEGQGTGSGFIIDTKGHIVTNAHVIDDAESVTVSLGVDNVEVPAKVIGEDKSSDLAVLKFDPDAKELDGVKLAVATFGDSADARVGDPVAAIGNPFGLDRTLTTGVVSALQRNIPSLNDFSISDVIQTDAAVNPGNSGGPLFNSAGEVIGVNSQISTQGGGFDGIAFAIPSNTVAKVSKELITSGSIDYAWLGVQGGELTSDLAKQLDVDVDSGVYIAEVTDGSPADKAGLEGGRRLQDVQTGDTVVQGGDVIVKFGGKPVSTMTELGNMVDSSKPGDKVEVEFIRDGKRQTTTVTLGERPQDSTSSDQSGSSEG